MSMQVSTCEVARCSSVSLRKLSSNEGLWLRWKEVRLPPDSEDSSRELAPKISPRAATAAARTFGSGSPSRPYNWVVDMVGR